jgi:methyl-accepting chemotaxis protein
MERRIRGSGLRHTFPYFVRYAALWLVVTITAVLVASVSSYLVFAARVGGAGVAGLRYALIIQTVLTILAVVALAVFTTHRLAGPWIAVRRALDAVRDGDLQTRLRFRASDPRIQVVEEAFEQMLASLRERLPK